VHLIILRKAVLLATALTGVKSLNYLIITSCIKELNGMLGEFKFIRELGGGLEAPPDSVFHTAYVSTARRMRGLYGLGLGAVAGTGRYTGLAGGW
jgi:hypothetical protein